MDKILGAPTYCAAGQGREKGNETMLKKSLYMTLALLFASSAGFADDAGLHYPHNETSNIGCLSCHYQAIEAPPEWFTHVPQDLDDTPYNNLCRSCHNDIIASNEEYFSYYSISFWA